MKIILGFTLLALITFNTGANANECAGDPIIGVYVDTRDNDISALDALSANEKEKIKTAYQKLIAIAEQQFVNGIATEASELAMRNDANLLGLSTENWNDKVTAINLDLLFSQMTAEDRVAYVNSLKGAVAALDESSGITFGQHNDRLNRNVVENALQSYGCPHDLLQDYGVPEYSP